MLHLLKNLLGAAVLAGLLAVSLYLLVPWLRAAAPQDDFSAAALLLDQMGSGGGDGLWFRRDTIDPDRVYQVLEAQLPYAFTMHCKLLRDGSSKLTIEVENLAAQEQAATFAQGVVQSLRLDGMDVRERLRALHDWLVTHCAYDLSIEEGGALDGSAPPFTAAGALVDGKAVCMGYARAYQMLCDAADIETFFVVSEEMNHAWNALLLDGELLFIDCTYDDPVPDRAGEASHEYFLLDAPALRETHTWDEEFYRLLCDRLSTEDTAA